MFMFTSLFFFQVPLLHGLLNGLWAGAMFAAVAMSMRNTSCIVSANENISNNSL
jgi:hypothetical protein